jgi:hypothetical protein
VEKAAAEKLRKQREKGERKQQRQQEAAAAAAGSNAAAAAAPPVVHKRPKVKGLRLKVGMKMRVSVCVLLGEQLPRPDGSNTRRGARQATHAVRPPLLLRATRPTSTPQGIKITNKETKARVLQILQAEQAAQMMDLEGGEAAAAAAAGGGGGDRKQQRKAKKKLRLAKSAGSGGGSKSKGVKAVASAAGSAAMEG